MYVTINQDIACTVEIKYDWTRMERNTACVLNVILKNALFAEIERETQVTISAKGVMPEASENKLRPKTIFNDHIN